MHRSTIKRVIGAALFAAMVAPSAIGPPQALAIGSYKLHLAVAPNRDVSGEPLTIYGVLSNRAGKSVEGVRLQLMHRVNPAPAFTPIQRGHTGSGGNFQFDRAEGVVISNREWYAIALSPTGAVLARSNVASVHVYAELTLALSASTVDTAQPVTFSGTVAPRHAGGRVLLERQIGDTGSTWRGIGSARIEAGGAFSYTRKFARPTETGEAGPMTVRAVLPGDARNIRSFSEAVTLTVQQAENAALTLAPSSPAITVGETVGLSGKLAPSGSTSAAGQQVTLYAHLHGAGFAPVATASTNSEGAFSFAQTPIRNTAYEVKAAAEVSAVVFEGVHDTISAEVSASHAPVGSKVTISGLVTPSHEGHIVLLEVRNNAGHYQSVQAAFVGPGSRYSFSHQLQSAGSKSFRVFIPGGPENLGAASAPFSVEATSVAVVPALEPVESGEGK